MSSSSPVQHIAILGAGLAGIASAVRLSQLGYRVTLVETRKRLGGRATSNIDPISGALLDNCQHVLLKCCTNLLDLYQRLKVDHLIEWHDTLHFLDRAQHHDVLRPVFLPAPAHLAPSFVGFSSLSFASKLAIGRGMQVILKLSDAELETLSNITFAQWLGENRQPREAIARFWELIIISALNETADRAAASYALQVFRDGFLPTDNAYVMGLPRVQLAQLYETAQPLIESAGGAVRLGTAVRALNFDGASITSVEFDDGTLTADVYISALPFDRLDKVISPEMRQFDPRLAKLGEFDVSPILGIHLWFDQTVMTLPHAVVMDSPVQWVFNRGNTSDIQHLHVVISAARDWIDREADEIISRTLSELRHYFPKAHGATLTTSRVIKEKRATFSATPAAHRIRPGSVGNITNLLLAGDWTQTGWPATMEGAVRSGYRTVEAITHRAMIVPPLRPDWLVALLQSR